MLYKIFKWFISRIWLMFIIFIYLFCIYKINIFQLRLYTVVCGLYYYIVIPIICLSAKSLFFFWVYSIPLNQRSYPLVIFFCDILLIRGFIAPLYFLEKVFSFICGQKTKISLGIFLFFYIKIFLWICIFNITYVHWYALKAFYFAIFSKKMNSIQEFLNLYWLFTSQHLNATNNEQIVGFYCAYGKLVFITC